jgi:4-amino-4-deoxy-L-arabinose transferase-like glycosyltransferase
MKESAGSPYFLLLVIALFLFASSPTLFSDGMFMDGIYYATIARNMAEGLGSLWKPMFTETLGKTFYDHPPLAFGLQSLFFKIFGDHHWVERLYSVLTYFAMGAIMIALWKRVNTGIERSFYWLPLLLWISVPKMLWGASNNLLENTMMLFIGGSILCFIHYYQQTKKNYLLVAGFCLFLAFLTKGVTSLFPLSFPFFYAIATRTFSLEKLAREYTLILLGLLIPFGLMFFLWEEGIENLQMYFRIQVVNSLTNVQSVDSRFYIIRRFSQEILTMLSLTVVLYLLNRWVFKRKLELKRQWILVFFATALSGVLPILISMKQSTFYIIPTFPLFATAFALLISPFLKLLANEFKLSLKSLRWIKGLSFALIVFAIVVVLLPLNTVGRDKKKLKDIKEVIEFLPPGTSITVSPGMNTEWSYYAYFYRYGYISLSTQDTCKYKIALKGEEIGKGAYFEQDSVNLQTLSLYKRK